MAKSRCADTILFAPILSRFCNPTYCKIYIVCSILTLLFHRDPSAIFWTIVSICVSPIQCQSWLPTILYCPFIKCHKIISPFITDLYSLASIVFEHLVFWIIATLFHPLPAIMDGMSTQTMIYCTTAPWHRLHHTHPISFRRMSPSQYNFFSLRYFLKTVP